jgi:hypothetical protein
VHTGFWYENLKEREYQRHLKMDGDDKILENQDRGVDWIHLAQDETSGKVL